MKKLLLSIVIVMCFVSIASSADWSKPKGDGYKFEISECGKDCMEIKTENNTLRIYSCGKVEKLDWKEINPNEDVSVYSTTSINTITGYPFESEEYAEMYCSYGYHKVDDYWVCD